MADGDDRDENDTQNEDMDVPEVEHLQIEETDESNIGDMLSEYTALDSQLDQLDACLDNLEARNDSLLSKLRAFVEANRADPQADPQASDDTGNNGGDNEDGCGSAAGRDGVDSSGSSSVNS